LKFVGLRHFFPCFLFVRVFSDARTSSSACWWQELERRARDRYAVLDRLDADYRWYQGQYEALEALVEAHRSPDWWLAYRAEALLDSPPEQGAQTAEGASAVVRVRTVLVERDDALRRAREDLGGHAPSCRRGRQRLPPPASRSNKAARRSRRPRG
jgi:hypothetical protein